MTIDHLTLYSTHLEKQWQFYNEKLGLPCHRNAEDVFQVYTLHTQLEFHQSGPEQYYHFAFLLPTDIPSVTNHFKIQYRSNGKTYHLEIKGDEIESIE